MRLMGDKTAARRLMREADVPMAPGTVDAIDDPAEAERVAGEIGYPVLVKAAAGGGGKGMRVVERPEDFAGLFERARSEAQSAFGDGRVYVERYLTGPRHIEIQVLADQHGGVVHLFERECSIQRRHQKVVEEAPERGPHARAARGDGRRRRRGRAGLRLRRRGHGRVPAGRGRRRAGPPSTFSR